MVRIAEKRCGELPKVWTPLVHSAVNRRRKVPRNMRRWVLLKENTVFKVWTLFILQWGVNYEQQGLEAALDVINA